MPEEAPATATAIACVRLFNYLVKRASKPPFPLHRLKLHINPRDDMSDATRRWLSIVDQVNKVIGRKGYKIGVDMRGRYPSATLQRLLTIAALPE